jgi:serine/threonine protein kinase/tetratricopeptide (TPR) repeat protein
MIDESIFAAALAIPSPSERAAYLDRACAGQPALRREVEALLAAHADDNPLDRPPADLGRTGPYEPEPDESPAASIGDRVGPYRLMEQIGEGGFGLVFVAEQAEPVRHKVALKVLKPGMDTRDVVARFEAERQALALMDHPNIAKVLDAGSTSAGRPYFVMELVRGVPITDYCDEHKLLPRDRLALFVQVCQAVQHAHQKGIIHRDLKPSNVLVTSHDGVPVPKVIDFGVAKAVGQSLTEKTIYTRFAQMIGTPLYMSPEQAEMSGLDVDTRADVYALGVLLYELLTGTTPFDRDRFRKAAFDEIRRIIKEEEPPRPSTRLSTLGVTLPAVSANRNTEPGKLPGLIRGELDWIVMRCLEKDRNRRYDTANGLARDIQRYLIGDAVEACPPTLGYRLRKLAHKHRKPLTAAAAFTVLLLAGAVISAWQAVRARQAERQARAEEEVARFERNRARTEKENTQAALDFLGQDVLAQVSPWQTPGQDPKIRRLLDRAADQLQAEPGKPPLVQASIRGMIGQIYAELGDLRKGRHYLGQALQVQRRALGEDDPQTLMTMHHLGRSLFWSNQYDEAAPILSRTLELRQRVLGDGNRDTLITMFLTGGCYAAQGRYEEAEQLIRQAQDALRGPSGDRRQAVGALLFLGFALATQGQLDRAQALLLDCLEQSRRDPNDHPHIAGAMRGLACVYIARNEPARAKAFAEEALKRCRDIWGEHPLTLNAIRVLARVYQLEGQYDQAAPLLKEAQAICRGLQIDEGARLASVLGMLGENLVAKKNYIDAEAHLRHCLEIWKKRLPHGGEFWVTLSRQGAAREYAFAKCLLGASLLGQKRFKEAEPLLLQSYEGLMLPQEGKEAGPTPFLKRRRVEALGWLVQLYEAWGKPDEVAKWRKELEAAKHAARAGVRQGAGTLRTGERVP